jgi:hypothetical protein
MIHEEYVSFDTAKLLKEAGWDIPTRGIYRTNRNGDYRFVEYDRKSSLSNCTRCLTDGFAYEYLAPTQALAARWIREVYKLQVLSNCECDTMKWYYAIYDIDMIDPVRDIHFSEDNYDTYEQAMEAGLQRAVKMIKERRSDEKDNV